MVIKVAVPLVEIDEAESDELKVAASCDPACGPVARGEADGMGVMGDNGEDVRGQQQAHVEGIARGHHEDSFRWGDFTFTWMPPHKRGPHGAWAVACPYHKLNDRTSCTKAMSVRADPESKQTTCQLLKMWCLQAAQHDRKRLHSLVDFKSWDIPSNAVLEARLAAMPPPPPRRLLVGDDVLDANASGGAQDVAQAEAAPKRRPRGGRPKAKAKQKAKAKAAANIDNVAEPDGGDILANSPGGSRSDHESQVSMAQPDAQGEADSNEQSSSSGSGSSSKQASSSSSSSDTSSSGT